MLCLRFYQKRESPTITFSKSKRVSVKICNFAKNKNAIAYSILHCSMIRVTYNLYDLYKNRSISRISTISCVISALPLYFPDSGILVLWRVWRC